MNDTTDWPISIIVPVILGIPMLIAELGTYDASQNGKLILTTLATVQAAIFAIVFSVVILGIQLSTSRYSARLADLFRSDQAYQQTVLVFISSIGIDIFSIVVFHRLNAYSLRFMITLALLFALIAVAVLYFFVDKMLEQTTPEGIIQRVEQELTPNQIIQKANTAEGEPTEPDPFQIPVSIIRSAIEDRDLPAVSLGLNVVSSQVSKLLESRMEGGLEETPVGDSLEHLCTTRLPRIGEKAVEEDLDDAGLETVDALKSIGNSGVQEGYECILVSTSKGYAELVTELDFSNSGERVRGKAITESASLLEDSVEADLLEATGTGIRTLGWRIAVSIVKRGPMDRNQREYTSFSLKYLPDILEKAIEGMSEDVNDTGIITGTMYRSGDEGPSPEQWVLWSCYGALAEATSAFLRYELEHEEQIVKWRMVASGWRKCASTLSETDFESLCQLWLGTIFYLDYIKSETPSHCLSNFNSRVRVDFNPEFLRTTIDSILDGEIDPTSRIDSLPGRIDPIEHPQTSFADPPVSDPEQSFDEWLERQKRLYRISRRSPGFGFVAREDEEQSENGEE